MGMTGELQKFHLAEQTAKQLKMSRPSGLSGPVLWKTPGMRQRLTGLRPAPQGAPTG